jgi:tRNA threonylcarbamoyladenosine biosynthesis protein TsaE
MTPALANVSPQGGSGIGVALADLAATERLAARLARHAQAGDVIGLEGPLGAGKTAFARGFIAALLGPIEVPSPTFTLVQVYEGDGVSIWHFDLYRLTKPEEADELGLDEALATGIALIEWPERLGDRTPPDRLVVRLEPGRRPSERQAHLSAHGPRARALLAALGEAVR